MNKTNKHFFLTFLFVCIFSPSLYAQADFFSRFLRNTEVVVGTGFGSYAFSGIDDFRGGDPQDSEEEEKLSILANAFLEINFYDWIGVGYRGVYVGRTSVTGDYLNQATGQKTEREIGMTAQIPTLQIIPFSYRCGCVKFGFVGGYGQGKYSSTVKQINEDGLILDKKEYDTTGSVSLVGAFLRLSTRETPASIQFGYNAYITDFDSLLTDNEKEFTADGSGGSLFFDVAYSF